MNFTVVTCGRRPTAEVWMQLCNLLAHTVGLSALQRPWRGFLWLRFTHALKSHLCAHLLALQHLGRNWGRRGFSSSGREWHSTIHDDPRSLWRRNGCIYVFLYEHIDIANSIMASVTLEHSLTGSRGTVGKAGGWPWAVRRKVKGFNFANLFLPGPRRPAVWVVLDQFWEPVALPY